MYLPLTGFREKSKLDDELNMNTLGPKLNTNIVQPASESAKATQEAHKVAEQQREKEQKNEGVSKEESERAMEQFYSSNSMSTQDFMVLRAQAPDETLEVLDKVISRMKENMEEVGEALEVMTDMIEKTSKDNIALQVLQKTLEAMDETSGKDK